MMEEHQGSLRICPKVSCREFGAGILAVGADHVLETTGSFPQSSCDCTTVTQPWELPGSVSWVSSHSSQGSEGPSLLPELPQWQWLIQVSDPLPPTSRYGHQSSKNPSATIRQYSRQNLVSTSMVFKDNGSFFNRWGCSGRWPGYDVDGKGLIPVSWSELGCSGVG